jgi:hypothetical protein
VRLGFKVVQKVRRYHLLRHARGLASIDGLPALTDVHLLHEKETNRQARGLHDVGTFLRHDLWFVGRDTVCDACSDTMVSGGVHGVYDADGRLVVGGWLMKKVQMSICKVMDTHNLINRKRHGRARILQSLDVMCQQRKTR